SLGIPIVSHCHVPLLTMPPAVAALMTRKSMVPAHDLLIAPSDGYAELMRAAFRPPENKLVTVHCGIDLRRFATERTTREEARAAWRIDPTARVIAVAGYLNPIKRPDLALEAFALALKAVPNALLVYAGKERNAPGLQRDLETRAEKLGIRDRVRF